MELRGFWCGTEGYVELRGNVKVIYEFRTSGYFYRKSSVSCQDLFSENIENNVKIKPNKFNT